MDILLWRHAHARDAFPGESDMDRPLTDKGQRQSEKMARWLNKHMPDDSLVLCSPAVRTVQTVQALGQAFTLCEQIKPESSAQALLKACQWPNAPAPVLVVAHQPFLSETVAVLLGLPATAALSFRKGALWWLRSQSVYGTLETKLLTIQDPDFL